MLSAGVFSNNIHAQESNLGEVHGDAGVLMQQYNPDTLIGAVVPSSKLAMNSFLNINYTLKNFRAGIRYESYLNRLEGYPNRFAGTGLGYRYAGYTMDGMDITVGSFYEQFGAGTILRTYEQRDIGIDNALDGIRVKYTPYKGIYLTGLYAKQRLDFVDGLINGGSIIRGLDGEVSLNELFDSLAYAKTRVILGGSFVSRFQPSSSSTLVLPENVGAWSARAAIYRGNVQLSGEYSYKINDPSIDNNFIYKPGQALLFNATYSKSGFSAELGYKFNDNFSFRSDRDMQTTDAMLGFIPTFAQQHTYNLAATLYPYVALPWGEVATQATVSYKFKKKSLLGGKYGTFVTVNYALAKSLDSTAVNDPVGLTAYETNFGMFGEETFFQDINVRIDKKISKKLKMSLMYLNFKYNNDVNQGANNNDGSKVKGFVDSHIGILETTYKFNSKNVLRTELQALIVGKDEYGNKQHQGDWATVLLEYTYSPHWFFSVQDQYNFGNSDPVYRIHYATASFGYSSGANRFSIGYGRQRAGLFCIGGVCRVVPASNGLSFSLTSTF